MTRPSPRTVRPTVAARRRAIIPTLALLCSCAAAATAAERTSVSVTFGKDAKQDGITTRIWNTPGGESVATYGGKTGLQTDLVQGAWGLWGDIDDGFIHGGTNRVKVSIEYWDKAVEGEQGFKLYYDSAQRPMSRAFSTFFTGSNTWKTAVYLLDNAAFGGRQEQGADFKLFCTDTGFCVRSITVEKIPAVVPTTAVEVLPVKAALVAGGRLDLTALYTPVYASDPFVTWSSSDPAVATVNRLGQVTGVAAGTAVITATHDGGALKAASTVTVAAVAGSGVLATSADAFLSSIGANSSIEGRGEDLAHTIACSKYLGLRWLRSGTGLPLQHYVDLNKAANVRYSLGFFGGDLNRFLHNARQIAARDLVVAFEGPNEPNNWNLVWQDRRGGGSESWVPVASLQRDLYNAVKGDAQLRRLPVWHMSEGGAEVDNVGVQFLAIPKGAGIAMPDGTRYADAANVHNYISHPAWGGLHDDQTWRSADPTADCPVDGLHKEFGITWGKRFAGYSEEELHTLPRVTTETGVTIGGPFTEELQGRMYPQVYLSQYKQGWSHTAMYLLRDRSDEGGNQTFGFYRPDYTPRKAATYLHNLTTILADSGAPKTPGRLDYRIANPPAAVHDLLLQKADGRFFLVVWGERYTSGETEVTVELGRAFARAAVYDTTVGSEPVQTLEKVSALPLKLGTNIIVIGLTP